MAPRSIQVLLNLTFDGDPTSLLVGECPVLNVHVTAREPLGGPPRPGVYVPSETDRRVKKFNYPCRGQVRPWKPGTKRARLIDLLRRPEGATFEECMDTCGWDFRAAQGSIRALWDDLGFGLTEDDQGRIRLVGGPTEG